MSHTNPKLISFLKLTKFLEFGLSSRKLDALCLPGPVWVPEPKYEPSLSFTWASNSPSLNYNEEQALNGLYLRPGRDMRAQSWPDPSCTSPRISPGVDSYDKDSSNVVNFSKSSFHLCRLHRMRLDLWTRWIWAWHVGPFSFLYLRDLGLILRMPMKL